MFRAEYLLLMQTRKRGRTEIRKTFVYKNFSGISEQWRGLNPLIRVERYVSVKKQQRQETTYYMSDIRSSKVALFARHIRNHWGMENLLHWVKDVILKEDESKIKTGMSAENIPVIRNIVCNLFRSNGFHSINHKQAEGFIRNFRALVVAGLTTSHVMTAKVSSGHAARTSSEIFISRFNIQRFILFPSYRKFIEENYFPPLVPWQR